jgi:hypothetical protein
MNTTFVIRIASACFAATLATDSAWAQLATAAVGPPPRGERRGPPPESIAACKSLKVEQACSFMSPKGAEKGSCAQRDASEPLACRPERRGPPPEALVACRGKALNAACTTAAPEGNVAGTCGQPDASSPPTCQPMRK